MSQAGGVAGKRRQRELAGDSRAGTFARSRARTQQWAFIRSNRVLFAAFLVVGAVFCGFVAWSMPNDLLAGVVVGGSVVALPGALWLLTTQMTGTVPLVMGSEAEQWTASKLRRLGRHGWRLVNHVTLRHEDIDHVLLGPGGAYAVETKWGSSWLSSYGRQRTADAVAQARGNARDLTMWHGFKSVRIAPLPVVVLWGPGLSEWAPAERVRVLDGVTVVVGSALSDWTQTLPSNVLAADQVAAGWMALEAQVGRRDPAEREKNPAPMSVGEWTGRLALSIGLTALGLGAFGQLLSLTRSVATTVVLALVALVPALPFTRARKWRWAAWSWISGLGIPTLALLALSTVPLLS